MNDFNWQGHREDSITAKERARNVAFAQTLIQERARRFDYFPAELFAEPAWDILLALYVAQMSQQRITAGQLTEKATIPHTTILRWTKVLDAAGYVLRRVDPLDARRAFVLLTPKGLDAMYSFLSGGSDQFQDASAKVNASQYRVGGDPMKQWPH
jgi:DNA-binding MarR family transcriptional regulator